MITGNKGEWSEIYTLLKILSDKYICAGNEKLEKVEELIFPVIKILRNESGGSFVFGYDDDIVVITNEEEQFRIPVLKFKEQAALLLDEIKSSTDRTFPIPDIEEFINSFNCKAIKAKSSVKSDIVIVIHDHRTGVNPKLGFSIKSQLGRYSTLLNASGSTNFTYRIDGVSHTEMERINAIGGRSKIKDRVVDIISNSGKSTFIGIDSDTFFNNLSLIDSLLPNIMAEMLWLFFSTKLSKTIDLVSEVTKLNPLGFDIKNNHPFYSYKTKRLLTDIALGMVPASVWTGEYDATGGFLVVKEDGDVLCYHIYNRNEFEDYLMHNTKFDTPSSSKHGFGEVYLEENELRIKLNLQIRFLK